MTRLAVAVGIVITTSFAHAQPPDTGAPPPPQATQDDRPRFTVTWAPLRALFGLAEFTAEYRVHDKVGVSITAGGGRRTVTFENMTEISGRELEGGAQARYYLFGDFAHGFELGAELLYEHVKLDEPLPPGIAAAAAGGLTIGPFAGYKVITGVGFTFEAQLGARYVAVDPPVTGMAMGAPPIESRWLPLAHINAGWSF